MEIISEMNFISEVGDFKEDLSVGIENKTLFLKLNKDVLFRTLKHRKEIVGFVNKKMDELVETFISEQANKQELLKKDL